MDSENRNRKYDRELVADSLKYTANIKIAAAIALALLGLFTLFCTPKISDEPDTHVKEEPCTDCCDGFTVIEARQSLDIPLEGESVPFLTLQVRAPHLRACLEEVASEADTSAFDDGAYVITHDEVVLTISRPEITGEADGTTEALLHVRGHEQEGEPLSYQNLRSAIQAMGAFGEIPEVKSSELNAS